jgi:hypothetical protein
VPDPIRFPASGDSVVIAAPTQPIATDADSLAADTIVPPKRIRRVSFLPVPVVGYAPETRFQFGLALTSALRLWDDARLSTARLEYNYTQNHQRLWEVELVAFLPRERAFIRFEWGTRFFPEDFFGLGNRTPEDLAERYEAQSDELFVQLLGQVWARQNLFLGPVLLYDKMYKVQTPPDGQLARGTIPGAGGSRTLALGGALLRDERDHAQTPRSGSYVLLQALYAGRRLGSTHPFNSYLADLRYYWTPYKPWPRHSLAFQIRGEFATGEPPFRQQPRIGSASYLRGYYGGRYRDLLLMTAQAEYRFPLFWRLAGTAFGGLGQVSRHWGGFRLPYVHPVYGMGGRFIIDRQNDVSVRLDVGFFPGAKMPGIYIGYAEAF